MRKEFIHSANGILICSLLFLCSLLSCRSSIEKNDKLILNPVLNEVYQYSLTRISSRVTENNTWSDTVKIDFSIQKIVELDSINTFKLTLNDYAWKKPPEKIKFVNAVFSQTPDMHPSVNILDSISFFIRGSSIEVEMNISGSVLHIEGIEELLKNVARSAHIDKGVLRSSISDHISEEAMKDMLNTIFSVVPGKKVQEADKWYPSFTLITKAPIKVSNIFELDRMAGDTAFISVQSLISAQQSEGGNVYMKGEQKGIAKLSYSTGMPYRYETNSETVTTTSLSKYQSMEYLLLEGR